VSIRGTEIRRHFLPDPAREVTERGKIWFNNPSLSEKDSVLAKRQAEFVIAKKTCASQTWTDAASRKILRRAKFMHVKHASGAYAV